MRISDWSSDVCSSDLEPQTEHRENADDFSQEYRLGCGGDDDGPRLDRERARSARTAGDDRRPRLRCGLVGLQPGRDRKSVVSGKSVYVRVDLGGRRSLKKTIKRSYYHQL